jgi:putative sterol carrier protein
MPTISEVFENMAKKMTETPDRVAGINAVYQFNITGDTGAEYYVNLKDGAKEVAKGAYPGANCTVTMSTEDFLAIIDGSLNAQMAFLQGKVKIGGDMGLAMKLGKILG